MHTRLLALSGAIAFASGAIPATAQAQAQTQAQAPANALEAQRPQRRGPSRWLEDYRFLHDPAKRTDPFDGLRYHELGDSSWLVLGAEARYTYKSIDNPNYGLTPANAQDDSYLMQRVPVHADLHLLDGRMRAFLQVQNTSSWGDAFPNFRDGNGTDIAQGFIDTNFRFDDGKATLRLGRQEIRYGQGTLFNLGNIRNMRLAFDGARAMASTKDGKKLDLIAVRPIQYEYGAMDNGTNDQTDIYGIHGTLPLKRGMGLDLYGFKRNIDSRNFQGVRGAEDRRTFGGRFFGNTRELRWTWDLMAQTGRHAGRDIEAWGLRSHTQYKLDSPYKVMIGAHFDVASGGRPNASTSRTFDPLYPKNGEYGIAGVVTQSNVILLGPSLGFDPVPASRVQLTMMKAWRQNADDYVYLGGMRALPQTLGNDERDIGTLYQMLATWELGRNLVLDLYANHMDAASAVTRAGGRDVTSIEFQISASF